ncbi:related to SGV1 - Cyclin-dependent protein kinase [Ustilago trichophora]|uniref:Related to SGV1 - Cyclin-dependent protein kinase n=1 Tax=Ustilago trichophora TaxID=86804 RepID=A0A5C3ES14_9BASI|nr:related to SGV1 - Cyclin-dependent protein kinase [Ustilago trichophora]
MALLPSFDEALAAPVAASTSISTSTASKRSFIGGSLTSSTPSIDWITLTTTQLIPHSDGLCSSVYRRPLTLHPQWPYDHRSSSSSCASSSARDLNTSNSSMAALTPLLRATEAADGLCGWICIKRVSADDQPPPHSISREISLLKHLDSHPNLAPLLCAIYDTSDPFGSTVDLIMPLYAATLQEVLNEPSLLPSFPQRAAMEDGLVERRSGLSISHLWKQDVGGFIASMAKQLFQGLNFLHAKRVAHRDVKPSNILLSHNGRLKLIDLGIAHNSKPLPDPLLVASGVQQDSPGGEEGEGERMVHQVGTGVYRAPELLFSPKYGYDAYKVDIWASGVSLAEFFTALVPNCGPSSTDASMPTLDVEQDHEVDDERRDWQKAFDNSHPFLPSPSSADSDFFFWEQVPTPPIPISTSNFTRTPLFTSQAQRGDIPLASAIFSLLGLPSSTTIWPEAIHFQPPLHRLPFAPTEPKNLLESLPLYPDLSKAKEAKIVVDKIIIPSLKLSAAARPTAAQLLAALQE